MNKKILITNSDDFGLNESITDAIIETHINGIMTSTSIMLNMPGFEYAINKVKIIETLGVGIHFNLTEGYPVCDPSKIPLLLNEIGQFKSNNEQRKNLLFGKEQFRQVVIELDAQLTKLLDYGISPSHFDSHHHITGLPVAFRGSMQIAKKFRIKSARITSINYHFNPDTSAFYKFSKIPMLICNTPKAFIHNRNKRRLRKEDFITPDDKILPTRVLEINQNKILQFLNVLSIIKPGVTEISFHPGYAGSYLNDSLNFEQTRINDYEIALNPVIQSYIKNNNILLANFKTAFHG